jgi:hypothetical protein
MTQAPEHDIRISRIQQMSRCTRVLPTAALWQPVESPVFRWNVEPADLGTPVPRELVLCITATDPQAIAARVSAYEEQGVECRRIIVAANLAEFPDEPYYALKAGGVVFRHVDVPADYLNESAARTRFERELTPVFRSTLGLTGIENPLPSRPLDYEPSPFSLNDAQFDDFIVRSQSSQYESTD